MLPTSILVPTDFSLASYHALDYAVALARELKATLHLVHAINLSQPELTATLSDEMFDSLRRGAYLQLERVASSRTGAVFGSMRVFMNDPRECILEVAKAVGAQLIVMGTHGRRGLARLFVGSVTEHVVRFASCPVLSVPQEVTP
ncbi:MAG TPA: universal stress protein [Kofleriaceae bacterium]|jgi:nucleotide-binding universal stress UspA family protein